jgi:hypothetical protein
MELPATPAPSNADMCQLVVALDQMRDAFVECGLMMREIQLAQESELRRAVQAEAARLIKKFQRD